MLDALTVALSKFEVVSLPYDTEPLPVATKTAVVEVVVGLRDKVGNEDEVTHGDVSKPEAETCF